MDVTVKVLVEFDMELPESVLKAIDAWTDCNYWERRQAYSDLIAAVDPRIKKVLASDNDGTELYSVVDEEGEKIWE